MAEISPHRVEVQAVKSAQRSYGLFTTEEIRNYKEDQRLYLIFSRDCAVDSALYNLKKQRVFSIKFHVKIDAETGIPKRFQLANKQISFCGENRTDQVEWNPFEILINLINKFEWIIE